MIPRFPSWVDLANTCRLGKDGQRARLPLKVLVQLPEDQELDYLSECMQLDYNVKVFRDPTSRNKRALKARLAESEATRLTFQSGSSAPFLRTRDELKKVYRKSLANINLKIDG